MEKTVSIGRGQKIVTGMPRDSSSHKTAKDPQMGGSADNLAHSLCGAAAVQTGNEKPKAEKAKGK